MLDAQGKYNTLSDQLRTDLETKAAEQGRYAKFKFAIAKLNPDGEQKTGGQYLYPSLFGLSPKTFDIRDPYSKKYVRIALVRNLKEYGASEDSFDCLKIREGRQGVHTLDMENNNDRDMFAYLLLHPKLEGGMFRDNNMPAIISTIDEVSEAKASLRVRNARIEALMVANGFLAKQVRDFACAMGWDENQDVHILKERIVSLAEDDPEFFKKFIDEKNIETRAIIQRAIDNSVISWIPVESKFVWSSNQQTIAVLERAEGANILDRMTDWVATSKNGQDVFTQIRKLLQALKQPA